MRWVAFICIFLISCSTSRVVDNGTPTIKLGVIDAMGNLYILYNNNRLVKFDDKSNVLATFDNSINGSINQVNVYNPQKILLYQESLQRVTFLDNQLAEIDFFFLDPEKYPDVPIVCMSNNNQIWIWDDVNKQLIKLDERGKESVRSYRMYDYNIDIKNPKNLTEKNNHVYLETDNAIFVFDNFGKFLYEISIKSNYSIRYNDNSLLYINEEGEFIEIFYPLLDEKLIKKVEIDNQLIDILIGKSNLTKIGNEGFSIEKI